MRNLDALAAGVLAVARAILPHVEMAQKADPSMKPAAEMLRVFNNAADAALAATWSEPSR